MAAEGEAGDEAVEPGNGPAHADFLERDHVALRVFVVDVLIYLFLAAVLRLLLQ